MLDRDVGLVVTVIVESCCFDWDSGKLLTEKKVPIHEGKLD